MWIIPFLGMEQKTNKHQPEWMGFLGHNYVFKLGFVLLNIRVSSNFAEKNHFPSPFRCYNPHVSRIFLGRSTSNQQVCRQVTQHHALFLFQSNLQRRRRTPVAALKATKDLRDVFLNVLIGCGQRCAPENQTWLARKSSRTIFWKTTKKKKKHKVNYRWRIFQQAVELNSRVCKFHPPMSILFYNITLGP